MAFSYDIKFKTEGSLKMELRIEDLREDLLEIGITKVAKHLLLKDKEFNIFNSK